MPTPTQSPTTASQPAHCQTRVSWSIDAANVQPVSFKDHSTINTNCSDHYDNCTEILDIDHCLEQGSGSLCPDFLEGYCKSGSACDSSHVVINAKQHTNILDSQYPECFVWGLKRMRSFLQ